MWREGGGGVGDGVGGGCCGRAGGVDVGVAMEGWGGGAVVALGG